jgi:hypothetical protein
VCDGRHWWRRLDNDWRLVMTRERDGQVCILERTFTPPWRQSCPAARLLAEQEA